MLDYLARFTRFLFGLVAPLLMVIVGVAIAGWGASMQNDTLVYIGGTVTVFGVLWCVVSYGSVA